MKIEELIEDNNILNIYMFGSYLYGTNKEGSDRDYSIIVKDSLIFDDEFKEQIIQSYQLENCHYNFYHQSTWEKMLEDNRIECLEAIFSPQSFHIKETIKYEITINSINLRKSISAICSNAYVKCKKKLVKGKDFAPYTAKKSLWHTIRILLFGIQCCKYGKIIDFTEANKYYNEIVNCPNNDWEYYDTKWKPFCNTLKTDFKKYSETEWQEYKNNIGE